MVVLYKRSVSVPLRGFLCFYLAEIILERQIALFVSVPLRGFLCFYDDKVVSKKRKFDKFPSPYGVSFVSTYHLPILYIYPLMRFRPLTGFPLFLLLRVYDKRLEQESSFRPLTGFPLFLPFPLLLYCGIIFWFPSPYGVSFVSTLP